MINKFTLRFTTAELERKYFEWKLQNTLQYQLVFTILAFSYSVIGQPLWDNLLNYLHDCRCLLLHYVLETPKLQELSSYNYLSKIILNFIAHDIVIHDDSEWSSGFQTCFWHFCNIQFLHHVLAIYIIGNQFLPQSGILILVLGFQLIWNTMSVVSTLSYCQSFLGIIMFRYMIESSQRSNFLTFQQSEQWNYLIEFVLPSWIVILKFDKAQDQLMVEKANKQFCSEFDIKDDFSFRKLIRQMKVFPESAIQQNLKPIESERVPYEQQVIKLLKSKETTKKEEKFVAYYKLKMEKERLFRFTQVYFSALQPMIMLLMEEITENKYDDLQNEIQWRDRYHSAQSKLYLNQMGSNIGLLKMVRSVARNKMNKADRLIGALDQEIFQAYLSFNNALNFRSLLKLHYNSMKYRIDMINLTEVQLFLQQDLKMSYIQKQRVHKQSKSKLLKKTFIKRSTSRCNSQLGMNTIKNDKQKLIQILLCLSEFIRFMIALSQRDKSILKQACPCGIPIRFQYKSLKKNPQHYSFKLWHPLLEVPSEVEEVLNRNWAGSQHNDSRWTTSNHFGIIQKLVDKLSELMEYEEQNTSSVKIDNTCEILCSAIPTAQYMLSQIGPFNLFFFKNKKLVEEQLFSPGMNSRKATDHKFSFAYQKQIDLQGKEQREEEKEKEKEQEQDQSQEKKSNTIIFLVYQDLQEAIDEINQVDGNAMMIQRATGLNSLQPNNTNNLHRSPLKPLFSHKNIINNYQFSSHSNNKDQELKLI